MSDTDSIARLGRAVAVTLIGSDSAADAKGHGPRRGMVSDGPADLFPAPRAEGRQPGPGPEETSGMSRKRRRRSSSLVSAARSTKARLLALMSII